MMVETNIETQELYATIGRLYMILEKQTRLLTNQDKQAVQAQTQLKQLLSENTVLKKTLAQQNGQLEPEPEPKAEGWGEERTQWGS